MNSPDPLDRLIASWQEPAAPASDLRRRVWRRIEAAEAQRPAARLARWRESFRFLFRQRTAIAWVMCCIGLGLVTAELRATRTTPRELGQVATLYLQRMNTLLLDKGGGPP